MSIKIVWRFGKARRSKVYQADSEEEALKQWYMEFYEDGFDENDITMIGECDEDGGFCSGVGLTD